MKSLVIKLIYGVVFLAALWFSLKGGNNELSNNERLKRVWQHEKEKGRQKGEEIGEKIKEKVRHFYQKIQNQKENQKENV